MIFKEDGIPVLEAEMTMTPHETGVCSSCFKEGTPTIELVAVETYLQTPKERIEDLDICHECIALLVALKDMPDHEIYNGVLQRAC